MPSNPDPFKGPEGGNFDRSQVRVRFWTGETDVMPLDMAEFVIKRLYGESNASRSKFAKYMAEYWKQRPATWEGRQ